jgi:hypothetical protein
LISAGSVAARIANRGAESVADPEVRSWETASKAIEISHDPARSSGHRLERGFGPASSEGSGV